MKMKIDMDMKMKMKKDSKFLYVMVNCSKNCRSPGAQNIFFLSEKSKVSLNSCTVYNETHPYIQIHVLHYITLHYRVLLFMHMRTFRVGKVTEKEKELQKKL